MTAARSDAEVHYVPSWAAVPEQVASLALPDDLVLTVGAGDVTMVGPEVLLRLRDNGSEPRSNAGGSR